ncbi:MAG TPA: DUF1028 domain-containing protein [Anaerolineae bacterium]|nr:DUF1028 domain-containing protein [Anaerolineae bacterium]
MTFSIVAYDPVAQEWGVATQSKFLAVGAVVPWARAKAGAIATQSYANTTFGPKGLHWLAKGLSAPDTLERLLAADKGRDQRQVGIVDRAGRAATFTGSGCHAWAGGVTGRYFAAQGNILTRARVVDAIAAKFEAAPGELADRLVAALLAGQRAGGDRRGQQSAAVLVVREKGGYAGFNDRYLDLRVDDDPHPIERLQEILELHQLYFAKPAPESLVTLNKRIVQELQRIAGQARHYRGPITGKYDAPTRQAVEDLIGVENLEDRWPFGTDKIDPVAYKFLQKIYPPPKRRAPRNK